MRSVPYSSIEQGVAATAGIDPTSILSHEKVLLAEYINDAIKFCWDYYPWAEFTKTEVRYFRDQYDPTTIYSPDQEVFYQGKYYRSYLGAGAGVLPTDARNWVEVGDFDAAPEWSENGVYFIGAKVKYNDKLYVVPNESEHPDIPYCFEIDGKLPDQFFTELDETFDRFIAYEQTGKDAIGTCLSITLEDPRYNDTTPLNWREDREGIYIEPYEKSFNKVWLRYRLEAPTFTSQSTTEEVPNFLAQAIKAYAYKSWLIGDGQHEKAQLQDIYGLDLLVRELDKIDSQQDRATPFTITKEPYRRLNAKQNAVAPVTADKIGALKSATITSSVSISSNSFAKNAVVKAYIVGDPIFTLIVFAENMVRKGFPACHLRVKSIVQGINAVKYGRAESVSQIRTGKAYRSINLGQVRAIKIDIVLSPPISTSVTMKVSSQGRNVVRSASVKPMPIAVSLNSSGRNVVRKGISTMPVKVCFKYDQVVGRNIVRKGTSVMPLAIGSDFTGRNVVQRGSATASIQFTSNFIGKNVIKKGIINSSVSVSITGIGKRIVTRSVNTITIRIPLQFGGSGALLINAKRERGRSADVIQTAITTGGYWDRSGTIDINPNPINNRARGYTTGSTLLYDYGNRVGYPHSFYYHVTDKFRESNGGLGFNYFSELSYQDFDQSQSHTGNHPERSDRMSLKDMRQLFVSGRNFEILTEEEINALVFPVKGTSNNMVNLPQTLSFNFQTPSSLFTSGQSPYTNERFRKRYLGSSGLGNASAPLKDAYYVDKSSRAIDLYNTETGETFKTQGYVCWHLCRFSSRQVGISPTIIVHTGLFFAGGNIMYLHEDTRLECMQFNTCEFTLTAYDDPSQSSFGTQIATNLEARIIAHTAQNLLNAENAYVYMTYSLNNQRYTSGHEPNMTIEDLVGYFQFIPEDFYNAWEHPDANYNDDPSVHFTIAERGSLTHMNHPTASPNYFRSKTKVAGEKE